MKIKYNFEFEEYESLDQISDADRQLIHKAIDSADKAYAPYSKYFVGVALSLDDGRVVTANNQENAAYPSGLCAERIAVFYANSNFPDTKIETIAITAKAENFDISEPVTPCGACRQVMAEAENRQQESIRVIMMGEKGKIYISESIANLLPLMFHAEGLKKQKH
nr:cytidine deaminase [Bacteroidota bacterium]